VTTPGSQFPVVTSQGVQKWWVIPEGFIGQLISGFSLQGPALHLYTVVESVNRPAGAVDGPFTTKLQAQASANKFNAGGQATIPNITTNAVQSGLGINAIGDFFNRLTESATWVRVGEVAIGTLLILVALNAMTKGPLRTATTKTVKSGAKVAKAVAK